MIANGSEAVRNFLRTDKPFQRAPARDGADETGLLPLVSGDSVFCKDQRGYAVRGWRRCDRTGG